MVVYLKVNFVYFRYIYFFTYYTCFNQKYILKYRYFKHLIQKFFLSSLIKKNKDNFKRKIIRHFYFVQKKLNFNFIKKIPTIHFLNFLTFHK